MLSHSLLLVSLSALQCWGVSPRINKLAPTITGSFVNFGKIDVVVHVNPKQYSDSQQLRQSSLFKPQLNSMFDEEPCSCNGVLNSAKSLPGLPNPSKLLNMLFGSHQKDQSSGSCCDSSEHIHEETIIYDIGPNPQSPSFIPKPIMPFSPNTKESPIIFPLEFIFPNNMQKLKPLPLMPEEKPSTTRRPTTSYLQGKKSPVKFVGGNTDILEQFKNLKFRQTLPLFHKNTVKKDLNLQKVADEVNSVVRTEATTDGKADAQTAVTDASNTMAPTDVSTDASANTV